MPLYVTATYQVKDDSVELVKNAIEKFTAYVKKNEPGTKMYLAWQEKDDPTKFIHFFIFENDEAQEIHSKSEAVKKFESVYTPNLINGPVIFTDFSLVATI